MGRAFQHPGGALLWGIPYLYSMKTNPALLKSFNEKLIWFLSYLYEHGGSEYKGGDYTSSGSYHIPDASNPNEFERMIEALLAKGWATCGVVPLSGNRTLYKDLKLTEAGIKEAEKGLPQIPMFGLISQEITTGDPAGLSKADLHRCR
jgi:hypothetical protein